MKRLLKESEIEFILDFIEPNKYTPADTSAGVMDKQRHMLERQLKTQMVYPSIIPELKQLIRQTYFDSLIQAGESVGVICAQSIGEKQTQTSLNTFHKAGQSEKTMTTGIPRFQELINATKNPKIINHKIFFTHPYQSVQELRKGVSNKIVGVHLDDLIEDITFHIDKKPEKWYDAFKLVFSDAFTTRTHAVTIKIKLNKMYDNKLTLANISSVIEREYDDLSCVFSPPAFGQIDVFVDTSQITIHEDIKYITDDNKIQLYLSDVVIPLLKEQHICGVDGVSELFFLKNNGEWSCETNALNSKTSSFRQIMALPGVDYTRTVSNNVWDIYETLDIEATRQFLIEEFMSSMDGINVCHTTILVDRMTHNGTVASITRYTLKHEESGPLGKASFEETMDNFLNAASQCAIEPTDGVSSSIICGKRIKAGTGMSTLSIDIPQLISS